MVDKLVNHFERKNYNCLAIATNGVYLEIGFTFYPIIISGKRSLKTLCCGNIELKKEVKI